MAVPVDTDTSYLVEEKEKQQQRTSYTSRKSYNRKPSVRMQNITSDPPSTASGRLATNQDEENQTESMKPARAFFIIKVLFGILFYVLVLVCTVFSKLTLVNLTGTLRNITFCDDSKDDCSEIIQKDALKYKNTVSLYWQLLLVMMVPAFIEFVRSLVFGVLGKTTRRYPWPRMKSAIVGVTGSIFEVMAISVFVILVMTELPPDLSLFLLGGVFVVQLTLDAWYTEKICCRITCSVPRNEMRPYRNLDEDSILQSSGEYESLDANGTTISSVHLGRMRRILGVLKLLLENKMIKIFAVALQISSIIVFIVLWCTIMSSAELPHKLRSMIAFPICLLILSVIWTNKYQVWITKAHKTTITSDTITEARYKSSFINSTVKLCLYPFITYIVFYRATAFKVDPWCLNPPSSVEEDCLQFSGVTLATFLTQVLTTLFAYLFAWVACTMTLSPYGLALPMLIATPLSAICYYIHIFGNLSNVGFFPLFHSNNFPDAYPYGPIVLVFLWIGQVLGIGFYLFTKRNIILSEDSSMFLSPSYDGVFFEQRMILNRQVQRNYTVDNSDTDTTFMGNVIERSPRTIFICSTMYRENVVEMRQMLTSIKRVAVNFEREKRLNRHNSDTYESHIFFDGALNGTQLQEFGLQLLSLLEDTLGVKPNNGVKKVTPYGMSLQYALNRIEPMVFCIHFKDKNLVKPKKRWSQVMYMNYVINYRIKKDDKLTKNNTYILTTDADIDFSAKSAVVLLDMHETNADIGAVCARTHPKGSGPLYWYQVFDYAIGHWFQKPAEHLLGCVLCSPGCFSVFRCEALDQVLETYSSLATNGLEFLMKDMGEDRWLCTLLIKQGWRLEYCAISEDQTYCPEDFGEFFGQRRRWIPSTIANIAMLISDTASITRKNDTVSILFIFFQGILVFSTAISPATVILVIASGLQSAYHFSNEVVFLLIALFIFVSVLYGAICLFASPKTQIDVAKLLSFVFAIIMVIVIAGLFKEVILDIFKDPSLTFLKAPNCSAITGQNISKDVADCGKVARYLDSLPNGVSHQFKLPVSSSVIYLGVFAITFLGAALMHPTEFTCLIHCIWYLIALPSGYLLLLIYSAANLDSQSWGTREGGGGQDKGLLGWSKYFKMAWNKLVGCCVRSRCCKPDNDRDNAPKKEAPKEESKDSSSSPECHADIEYERLGKDARKWLVDQGCSEDYIQMFSENGYTTKHYIAAMLLKDFEEIGIDKRGFRLRLAKAAKRLPSLPIHVDVPEDVGRWLRNLEMSEYTQLFRLEGYQTGEDIENLKGLTSKDLQRMGIRKRAHLQRLTKALHSLAYPKEVEQRMYHTKGLIENVDDVPMDEQETQFWNDLIAKKLKPVSAQLTSIEEVKESLRSLRNSVLVVMFLVNIMWIIALFTVEFPRLADYGIDPRAFQLLFLFVYGFIIIIQFLMMICHRGITLVHYFGRIKPAQVVVPPQEGFENVSFEEQQNV